MTKHRTMKQRRTIIILAITTMAIVLGTAPELYAQIFPPPEPQGVPLDPLSWVMLAAGGGVAAKKYYNSRKKGGDEDL